MSFHSENTSMNQTKIKSILKKRSVKFLLAGAGVFLALMVGTLIFVSSGFFGRKVILPIAASQTGLSIAADQFKISPGIFPPGRVRIKNLVVGITSASGDEILALPEADVRFSLYALAAGRLVITEGEVKDLESNLSDVKLERLSVAMDAAAQKQKKSSEKPKATETSPGDSPQPGKPKSPNQQVPLPLDEWLAMIVDSPIRIGELRIKQASVKYEMTDGSSGDPMTFDWPDISATIKRFGYPGETATIDIAGHAITAKAPSSDMHILIAQPHFRYMIDQPATGSTAGVLIRSKETMLGGISGKLMDYDLPAIDLLLPVNATLTDKTWSVDELHLQARVAGQSRILFDLLLDLVLNPTAMNSNFNLSSLDNSFLNLMLGQNGKFAFDEDGVKASGTINLNLNSNVAEWSFEKVVSNFSATMPAHPEFQFKPLDVDFKNSGSWSGEESLIKLDVFTIQLRESDQLVVDGRLAAPMHIPLAGAKAALLDSQLSLLVDQLNLAQFNPILSSFIDGEIGGSVSSNLSIMTENESGLASVKGDWKWEKAIAQTPWLELADAGRRNYEGVIDVTARQDLTVNMNALNSSIIEGNRSLASMSMSGQHRPGEDVTIKLTAQIPASAGGQPLLLAHSHGQPIAVRSLDAVVDGAFDIKSQKSNFTARGKLNAPIPTMNAEGATSAASQPDIEINYDLRATQSGQEWTLNLKDSQVALLDKGRSIMTATAASNLQLVADFENQPALTGVVELNIDRIDETAMNLFAGNDALPTPAASPNPSINTSSPSKDQTLTDTSQSAKSPNALTQTTPNSGITIPIFDWKEFDLTILASLGSAAIMGHELAQMEYEVKVNPHKAGSTGQSSAFEVKSTLSGKFLKSDFVDLGDFRALTSSLIDYTTDGQIGAKNISFDLINKGQSAITSSGSGRFNLNSGDGELNISQASLQPAAWGMLPMFSNVESINASQWNASASLKLNQFGQGGQLNYKVNASGLRPRLATDASQGSQDMSMASAGVASWNNWGESIAADNLSGVIETRGVRLAEMALSKPLRVERRGDDWAQWNWSDTAFSAAMNQFDLAMWNDLLEPFGMGVGQGMIDCQVNLLIADSLKSAKAVGKVSLKDVAWIADQWSFSKQAPLSGAADFDFAITQFSELAIRKFEGRMGDSAGNSLNFNAGGLWHLDKGGSINLDINSKSANAGSPWSPFQMSGMSPSWLAMDVKIRSTQDAATGQSNGQITWTMTQLNHGLENSLMDNTAKTLDLAGAADFSWSTAEASLNLKQSDITLYPINLPGKPAPTPGKITTTGNLRAALPMSDKPVVAGAFDIGGQNISAQFFSQDEKQKSIDDLMKEEERRERAKANANATAESQAPPPQSALLPFDATGIDLTWKGEFDNISVAPMVLSKTTFDGAMKSGLMTTTYNAAAAPKGTISGKLSADLTKTSPAYQSDLSVNDIPVEQFASAFVPFLKDRMNGNAFCDATISASGIDVNEIMPSLDGKITFQALNGQLNNIRVLDEIVRVTGFKELNVLKFFTAKGDININKGIVNVNYMDYQGEFQKMGFGGTIDVRNLDSMPIDLKIRLALGAPLITKLGRHASFTRLTDSDGYLKIPQLIGMTGTLEAPKTTISGGSLIRDVKDGGIDYLRNLLIRESGQSPADAAPTSSTPTPAPAVPSPSPTPEPAASPAPTPTPGPLPTPDNRSDKEKLRDEAIGIGIGILDGVLKERENRK